MKKRGFTIMELLMVIAIIGILLGLTVTATTGVVRKARERQAEACVALVNQGIAAYYAQHGKWPGPIGGNIESYGSEDRYELSENDVRMTVKVLVDEARMGRPVMDISGLYVCKQPYRTDKFGMDFLSAIHGTRKNKSRMSSSEMVFGYPESSHGWFRRFRAYYYPKTDQLVFTE